MPRFLSKALLCLMLSSAVPAGTALAQPMDAAAFSAAGVAAYDRGALDEAARLFELGARGGNRLAKFNLAMMLYREETTSNDHNAAWRWLRRA